jgi:hypothetical protein
MGGSWEGERCYCTLLLKFSIWYLNFTSSFRIGETTGSKCWDYCKGYLFNISQALSFLILIVDYYLSTGFSQVDSLSTALVNIVDNQNFDGIDIDYVRIISYADYY